MIALRFARRFVHGLEGAGAIAIFALFRFLPLEWASGLGGFLARSIGPWLAISRRAHRNLRRAMPEIGEDEARRIVRGRCVPGFANNVLTGHQRTPRALG